MEPACALTAHEIEYQRIERKVMPTSNCTTISIVLIRLKRDFFSQNDFFLIEKGSVHHTRQGLDKSIFYG